MDTQKEAPRHYLTPGTWLVRLEAQKSLVLDELKDLSAQMLALQIQTWKLNARLADLEHMERNAMISECGGQIVKYIETDNTLCFESVPRGEMGFQKEAPK